MRSLAFVSLMILAALAPREASAQVLWVQPAPMLLSGPSLQESLTHLQLRALSVGTNVPVLNKELVLELQLAPGAKQGTCGTTWFWGGWASAGVLFPLGKSPTDGLFVQPKLTASYFDQAAEGDNCVDATQVRWSSAEFGLGVDVGFQVTLGPLYAAPLLGVYVGECVNCPPQTTPLTPYTPYLGKAGDRLNHLTFGLNLNLLRVGLVF